LFPRVPGVGDDNVRRALIHRFDFWLIFEVTEPQDELLVLALWHSRRRSGEWQDG
jgi:hypothetical protein